MLVPDPSILSPELRFLSGSSEAARLCLSKDWSKHPLGPPQLWSTELKTAVSIALNSLFPMFVAWGPERSLLYNDRYIEILGDKHPSALGNQFQIVWSEVWDDIKLLVEKVDNGESVNFEDLKLNVFRRGFSEEACFTFSYGPIANASGDTAGLICVVIETTKRKNSEQAYRDLANSMTQLAWMADANGSVQWYNERWYEYTGTNLDEMRGWGWGKVHHPDHLDQVIQFVQAAWKKPEIWELTFPLRSAAGEHRWFLTRAVPLKNEAGEIVQWFGTSTDIENQRIVELALKAKSDALEQSQENLKYALSSSNMGSWNLDLNTGGASLSDEARQIFGYESEYQSSGEAIDQFLHPEDRENAKKKLAEALTGHLPYRDEMRIIRPTGEIRWIDTRARARYNDQGQPTVLSGIVTDITERKNAEIKLRESELRFKSALKNARMGSWKINVPSGIMEADEYFREFHHIPITANIRTATQLVAHPDDQAHMEEALENSIQQGVPYSCEYRIKDGSGSYKWVAARGEPIFNEKNEIIAISGVAFENQEQKEAEFALKRAKEAAEIANTTKSAFLANMSHEIRTPLAAILGFSGLLKESHLDAAERNQYIETIIRNGTSLTRIIDDILDLAKVEAGRLDVEEVPFSISNLAAQAVELFGDKAKSKGIYLRMTIDEQVPKTICSDPTRLRQILVNLIGNAVKFTEKGGVDIRLHAVATTASKIKITVDVDDTGIGLSPEQKERLFSPFTQADNSMTRKFGGTGLGLALSQRLSQALSGQISITRSQLGKGCTFSLSFVAALLSDDVRKDVQSRSSVKKDSDSLAGFRILVVDDSPDNLFLVARLLVKNGALVETAMDGDEGLKKALAGFYDAVLMDLQMPNMDGYQAKFALDQNGFKKPVIALTAHAMADERLKTKAAGFAGHLTKPLISAELLKTLLETIKNTAAN